MDKHPQAPPDPGFGIYVHWPFCRTKCPYCDFNSHVREKIDEAEWASAYLRELERHAALTRERRVTSIFFGGGTPSLMAPETAAAIISAVRRLWQLDRDAEITIEANPTSVEAGRFAAFAGAGINRVSLGVQALDERVLKFLGRAHSVAEALSAVDLARRYFPRFSFDLIYARPGQTLESWKGELQQALGFAADHLSLYTLTIEPNTGFAGAVARGEFTPTDDETNAALYELTQDVCAAAGLPAYEISNHAKPGSACRHNLTYWRYGDYVGIGPGAHGRYRSMDGQKSASRTWRKPEVWLEAVAAGSGDEAVDALDQRQQFEEAMLTGLRLAEGVDRCNLKRLTGLDASAEIEASRLARLIDGGFLTDDGVRLRATAHGLTVLDALIGELLA